MKNSLKKNPLIRIFNYIMNETHIYPFFKLRGPLKGIRAKIYNINYIWRAPEVHVAEIMKEKISKGETVIDVGTHFGYYTLLMAKMIGPSGKVISFEPAKETRNVLMENIIKNKYQNRVKVEHKGVSNEKKILEFCSNKFSPMNSFTQSNSEKRSKIECIDLDSYCEENSIIPHFLKIDVEGVEKEVIDGMKKILKKYKPQVLLEADSGAVGIGEIFKFFQKNKYKIYTWKKRLDEDSWTDLVEITKPDEIITKHVYFEKI